MQLNLIQQFILDLISSKKIDSSLFKKLSNKEISYLINLSIKHRISSLLRLNLKSLVQEGLISENQIKKLDRASTMQSANSILILKEASNFFRILSKKNIDYIPLKGVHLVSKFYKDVSKRCIRDIDVLISKNQINDLIIYLLDNGYYFKSNNYNKNNINLVSFETKNYCIEPIYSPSGVCIEIHHRISSSYPCIFTEEFFKKKIHSLFGNIPIEVMSNENLFLHIIYHATSKQGLDVGPQALMDLKKILDEGDLDYNELFRLSILYKLGPNLAIFSSLFSEYFDCDKLINNIDSRYKFDKAFIDKIMKLMIFNSSSRSSIMLFRNKIKLNLIRGFSIKNLVDESFYKTSRSNYVILFIRRFMRHVYTYIPILIKYTLIKQYRNDNRDVINIMNKIEDLNKNI